MKLKKIFAIINLLFLLKLQGQCIKISSLYENTLFRRMDNVINFEYDTLILKLINIESSNDTGFNFNKISNEIYLIQTGSNNDITLKFKFKNKFNGNMQYEYHKFQVKYIQPPSLYLDNFKSGDTIKISQLDSVNAFKIEFKPILTLNRNVFSLNAVFDDSILSKFEFNKNEDFNTFKEKLIKTIRNGGTLLLYNIIVRIDGCLVNLNPVQFIIIE